MDKADGQIGPAPQKTELTDVEKFKLGMDEIGRRLKERTARIVELESENKFLKEVRDKLAAERGRWVINQIDYQKFTKMANALNLCVVTMKQQSDCRMESICPMCSKRKRRAIEFSEALL